MSTPAMTIPATDTRSTPAADSLPKTMRAIVAYAPGDYRLETVPVPRAGTDDMIVKVEAFDWNCKQHITPRYTREELRDAGKK